ncbi:MAG: riboflavin biosynthesis protein RibF [Bacteroidales bacterium]|nr:riboflavin biosynthesis protein RibF [Bacteroidales bacterium]
MVIATGFFDGVHLGHRLVISQLVDQARTRGDESMVVTFWPHPRNVLQKDARVLRLLTSLDEKKSLLRDLGVDHVEIVPFTKEFSTLSTREYFRDVIIGRFGGKAILLGYDNRVGGDNQTPEAIESIAREEGLDVIRTDAVAAERSAISSTRIRAAVAAGDVESAAMMLGRGYSLYGVVVAGNQLGRTIGFPTANMQLYEPLKLVPANGVYEVDVEAVGRRFKGMCNIGVRPTVGSGGAVTIETNIFGLEEDIYGLDIRITFIRRIREERKFGSIFELKAQLEQDKATIMGLSL